MFSSLLSYALNESANFFVGISRDREKENFAQLKCISNFYRRKSRPKKRRRRASKENFNGKIRKIALLKNSIFVSV